MKRRVTVAVFLIIVISLSCSASRAVYETPGSFEPAAKSSQENSPNGNITLAEVINAGSSSITWSPGPWINRDSLTHLGIILGKQSTLDYDAEAQYLLSIGDYVNIIQLLRIAEIDGYTSPSLVSVGKQALTNHPMVGPLPANYQGLYLIFYGTELFGYKYAQQWSTAADKWNMQTAYNFLASSFDSCGTFLWSLTAGGVQTTDTRHYDGGAQTLRAFLIFDEMGVSGASAEADKVWARINSYEWPGYYPYHLGTTGVECEICFSMVAGEYMDMHGGTASYSDRLIPDINYKLLQSGWDSADWNVGGYTMCHAGKSSERRLPNTQIAFMVLHAYYPQFTDAMKASFRQELTGVGGTGTPAWEGLVSTDLCQGAPNYKFRQDNLNDWNGPRYLDTGTANADVLMFLEGIIPSTGSLNIPKRDEVYEDICSALSAKDFLFDYAHRLIRIPVRAGELKFQFGTGVASYNFPQTATYTVQFSNDWNSIESVKGYGLMSVSGTKKGSPVAFEAWVDNGAHVTVGTAGYTFSSVTAGQHTVYGIYNTTLLVQTVNVQTSQTTSVFFNFDQRGDFTYSPIPAVENLTTTFDASDLAATIGNITGCTWDFGDGNIETTPNPTITHLYTLHGIYNVTLTIENSASLTNSTWMLVDVLRRDVAILDVAPYSSGVYEGYPANTNVTVVNIGDFAETATVDLYYNLTAGQLIDTKTVSLDSSESRTLTFAWNTTSVQNYHNYTITAVAETGFDSNLTNNLLESSLNVEVKIPVDANGDRKVDVYDAIIMTNAFGSHPGNGRWNAVADANEDGIVDIYDVIMLVSNFGKTYS